MMWAVTASLVVVVTAADVAVAAAAAANVADVATMMVVVAMWLLKRFWVESGSNRVRKIHDRH